MIATKLDPLGKRPALIQPRRIDKPQNDLHSHLADMVGSRSCIARYVSGSVSVPKTIGRRLFSGSPHNCRVQGFSAGSKVAETNNIHSHDWSR